MKKLFCISGGIVSFLALVVQLANIFKWLAAKPITEIYDTIPFFIYHIPESAKSFIYIEELGEFGLIFNSHATYSENPFMFSIWILVLLFFVFVTINISRIFLGVKNA